MNLISGADNMLTKEICPSSQQHNRWFRCTDTKGKVRFTFTFCSEGSSWFFPLVSPGTCRHGLIISADQCDLYVSRAGHADPHISWGETEQINRCCWQGRSGGARSKTLGEAGALQTCLLHPNAALNIHTG